MMEKKIYRANWTLILGWWGNENGTVTLKISLVVSNTVKHVLTIWHSNSTHRYLPQIMKVYAKYLYVNAYS